MILSAVWMVESLWAMTIVVTSPSSFRISSMAFCTSASFFLSRALVASSKISNFGFLMKARARARRYFCPPEKAVPPEPALALIPSESAFETNSHALVFCRASMTS